MRPLALAAVVLAIGCGAPQDDPSALNPLPPDSILSRDVYKSVLTEALLIEAAGKQRVFRNDNDSIRLQAAYDALFAGHGIERADFERSQRWWFSHAEAMVPLLQEVTEALSAQERELEQGLEREQGQGQGLEREPGQGQGQEREPGQGRGRGRGQVRGRGLEADR